MINVCNFISLRRKKSQRIASFNDMQDQLLFGKVCLRIDNAIHRINHFPINSSGYCYPPLKQLGLADRFILKESRANLGQTSLFDNKK